MASPAAASHLVEIADPPVPSRSSPVREMSLGEKLKIILKLAAFGLALCAGSWWLLHNGYMFYGISAGACGALFVIAALGGTNLTAACPYCGASIDTIATKDRGEGKQIHCEKCYEYSTVNTGILRPLDPATTSETPKFESPVFRNCVWPKGCVACGEAPVRFDDLSKTTVGGVQALMGHLAVIRGSVSGIPYCDKHRDKVSLKVSSDKKLWLCWTSLRMMRRYLAANRNRPVH
jgi:hypothetical protein